MEPRSRNVKYLVMPMEGSSDLNHPRSLDQTTKFTNLPIPPAGDGANLGVSVGLAEGALPSRREGCLAASGALAGLAASARRAGKAELAGMAVFAGVRYPKQPRSYRPLAEPPVLAQHRRS